MKIQFWFWNYCYKSTKEMNINPKAVLSVKSQRIVIQCQSIKKTPSFV